MNIEEFDKRRSHFYHLFLRNQIFERIGLQGWRDILEGGDTINMPASELAQISLDAIKRDPGSFKTAAMIWLGGNDKDGSATVEFLFLVEAANNISGHELGRNFPDAHDAVAAVDKVDDLMRRINQFLPPSCGDQKIFLIELWECMIHLTKLLNAWSLGVRGGIWHENI